MHRQVTSHMNNPRKLNVINTSLTKLRVTLIKLYVSTGKAISKNFNIDIKCSTWGQWEFLSFGGKIMTNFYCHKEAVFVCFQNNNGMHSRGLSEEEWRPRPVISDTIFLKISFKASFLYPYNWVSMSYLKFAQLEN